MMQYKTLGYSDEWIQTRVNSIQVRKELTEEWKKSGVKEGLEYAILTNLLTEEWSGKSVNDYKKHKGLKKENLRDNMTNVELALNMLAEATTGEIHHNEKVAGLDEAKTVVKRGAGVAKTARIAAEKETGVPVVSAKSASEISGRKNTEPLDLTNRP
ncbi:hypothetical protein FACS1894125_7200 [Actinomycetota bacterium]|nr:hypothetical protein FACS1894125_7200 [Actinomycetota bacterium]